MNRNGRQLVYLFGAAIAGAAFVISGILIGQTALRPQIEVSEEDVRGLEMMDQFGLMAGPGVMEGAGMMGGPGMMTGYMAGASTEPLSIQQAEAAVEAYLQTWGYEDLEVGEIMVFDNHAYAAVEDPASRLGAFEVLIDPITRAVFLEYGPSMMWNLEYGMMGVRSVGSFGGMMGGGMMPGMMDPAPGLGAAVPLDSEALNVTPEGAVEIAERYLQQYLPETEVGDEVDEFPGYYTIHTLQEGEVSGMLSVNALTGQAWYHSWHGKLLEIGGHSDS